jgi:hypothetical protein
LDAILRSSGRCRDELMSTVNTLEASLASRNVGILATGAAVKAPIV